MRGRTVAYVFPTSHRFRVPFHELLRTTLAAQDIDYQYIYCRDDTNLGKGDTEHIAWAISVPLIPLRLAGTRLAYQAAYKLCRNADLVILQQQNNLLGNFPIQFMRRCQGQRVAFFGHGRNFQSSNPNGLAEQFKKAWSRHADWWFAYTDRCAQIVEGFGFPSDRITVFNNAVDTTAMQLERARVTPRETAGLRERMFGGSHNVGIYFGGLYPEKRIGFLLQAATRVRQEIDDFNLVVVGGGPEADVVKAAASGSPWIHFVGPQFGREKAQYAAAARVVLVPGLVGLAVLDSFAYGAPLLTTDYPLHSPEIDYLKHGENGLMVQPYTSVAAYSDAVIQLLRDDELHARLARGAEASARSYTIEAMVARFAGGVTAALEASPR